MYQGKTIQFGDRLTRPYGGILNNHVARDKSSIRGTGLTNTHSRILNTRVPVTSPTRANYPAIHFHLSKYPCPLFPSISIQREVHMIVHIMYRGKQSNAGIVWLNHTKESSTTMWPGTSRPTGGLGSPTRIAESSILMRL
ncbi:hypothetical protein Pyn_32612 [Prunus yedoensis var. nudiflora]|uniref:Uncharacterized protein n=1 Tax=Prunus yedoensis var. nudiflora TaxID=2094558 RepID=A0A314YCD2_PRUYE|nr:hypothetical protein Pyn_32612 [Prunus yedoensis var. nudiflora]